MDMDETLISEWARDSRISKEAWNHVREDVLHKLGIDLEATQGLMNLFMPNHQAFNGMVGDNWLRLLPENAVTQIYKSGIENGSIQHDALCDTVLTIAIRTHKNIANTADGKLESPISKGDRDISNYIEKQEDKRTLLETGQVGFLVSWIIGHFSGNVDLGKMGDASGQLEGRKDDAPESEAVVLVSRTNEQNFKDVGVFAVQNLNEFFGDYFGDSTAMFKRIREANLKPDYVATNVVCDLDGNAWGTSPIPNSEIMVTNTEDHSVEFRSVANPKQTFGETWGTPSEMWERLSEDECVVEQQIDTVAWKILLGL